MYNYMRKKLVLDDTEVEVATSLIQISFYLIFAIVTTIICISSPSYNIFFFRQSLDSLFINRENDILKGEYEALIGMGDWISFVGKFFLRNMNMTVSNDTNLVTLNNNYMIGAPRIRQIRVRPEPCHDRKVLKTKFHVCYPPYTYDNEETSTTYKGTPYYNRSVFQALPFIGNAQKYNGPGYLMTIKHDAEENEKILHNLKLSQWIDYGTRLLIIELLVYNIDTLIFGTVQLAAEALPTGAIVPHWEIDSFPLVTIWSPHNKSILSASIIFYLQVLYYTAVEIQELLEVGLKEFILNAANIIDLIITVSAYVAIELTVIDTFRFRAFASDVVDKNNKLFTLDVMHFGTSTIFAALAICVFLVWAKLLRFIGFNLTMIQFQTTLKRCTKDILGFAAMFTVVFMGFSLGGLIIFGDQRKDFNTFKDAFFSMVRMVLGDFQFTNIQYTNRILCPVFYLFYVIFISLILLNMFLAIINNTYSLVKEEMREHQNALKTVMLNLFKRIKNRLYRRKTVERKERRKSLNATDSVLDFMDNKEAGSEHNLNSLPEALPEGDSSLDPLSKREDVIDGRLKRLTQRVELLEKLINDFSTKLNNVYPKAAERRSAL